MSAERETSPSFDVDLSKRTPEARRLLERAFSALQSVATDDAVTMTAKEIDQYLASQLDCSLHAAGILRERLADEGLLSRPGSGPKPFRRLASDLSTPLSLSRGSTLDRAAIEATLTQIMEKLDEGRRETLEACRLIENGLGEVRKSLEASREAMVQLRRTVEELAKEE